MSLDSKAASILGVSHSFQVSQVLGFLRIRPLGMFMSALSKLKGLPNGKLSQTWVS